jgi:subtilase family serine protease
MMRNCSRTFSSSFLLGIVILVGCLGGLLLPGSLALAAPSPGLALPSCLNSAVPPRCYTSQQMRTAYAIQPLLDAGITGKGRTIVIVGHNPSPSLQHDLHLFDQQFDLGDPTLNIFEPFGPMPSSAQTSLEATADVEAAHAFAPGATLDLVLVDTSKAVTSQDFMATFLQGMQYAVDHNLGDVISLSVGAGAEPCLSASFIEEEHHLFQEAQARHMTVLAASGDVGAAALCFPSRSLTKGVLFPASDPLVTAVGGTTLDAAVGTGTYRSETAWNEPGSSGGKSTSGGGFSSIFPRPAYQRGVTGSSEFRGVPDVALDADFLTGMLGVVTVNGTTTLTSGGGTSVGAPEWAGLVALADQLTGRRVGFINAALYRIGQSSLYHATFHDITTGNNTYTSASANGQTTTIQGYQAGPGWDAVTGLGTPQAAHLIPLLARTARPSDGNNL